MENTDKNGKKQMAVGTSDNTFWRSMIQVEDCSKNLSESDESIRSILTVLGRATGKHSVDEMCKEIVHGVREYLCIDRVGLSLWDEESQSLRGTYGTGLDGRTTDEHHVVWDIWPGGVWEQIVNGSNIIRGCKLGEPKASPQEEKVKADLIAFRHSGRLYGVLSVDNRISRRPLTDDLLYHLTLLSQVLGNAVEISRAKSALAKSEERLLQIAQGSRQWIWELGSDGSYTYSSDAVSQILGYTPAEVMGRHFTDLVTPEDKARIEEVLLRVHRQKKAQINFRHRHHHRYNQAVTLESIFLPKLSPENEFQGYWGVHRDVTREVELEEELRHSQKMEAVGRLAGGIAHDFNNLLTTILGSCSLLQDRIDEGDLTPQDHEEVQLIQEAGERAAKLTKQLLAYSRKQVLHNELLDLNKVVEEIEILLRRTIGEDIELKLNLSPTLDYVDADSEHLKQVIVHIAINAKEAMVRTPGFFQPDLWSTNAQGKIRGISNKRLTIETASHSLDQAFCARHSTIKPGEYVLLSISDTGKGMPKDIQEHVFEPFYTTKEFGRGSGLGLSTSYGIIKQMGGEILIQSAPGEGTTFNIYLPKSKKASAVHVPAKKPQPDGSLNKNITVLVVEDEEDVRKLILKMLAASGYETLQATNGQEALNLCLSYTGEIHLIITDMVMPQMSGRRFIEALKKEQLSPKVLYVSGYHQDELVDGKVLGEKVNYLQKPFSRNQLLEKVRDVLHVEEES